MMGVDSVLRSSSTKARKNIIDSGVAGRNMVGDGAEAVEECQNERGVVGSSEYQKYRMDYSASSSYVGPAEGWMTVAMVDGAHG